MAHKPIKSTIALERLEITHVHIDDIHPNDYNPNRQSTHDFELLCRSMEEDGFTTPIIVQRKDNVIVDGEHRWRAAKVLGYTQVPVVFVDMTPEQMRISTLRHNRARGTEDAGLVSEIIRDLQKLGALDWAADSLMMDNHDIDLLTQQIAQPESSLERETSGPLTFENIETFRQLEEEMQSAKAHQEKQTAVAEGANNRIIKLTYTAEEYGIITQVIQPPFPQSLVALCRRHQSRTA